MDRDDRTGRDSVDDTPGAASTGTRHSTEAAMDDSTKDRTAEHGTTDDQAVDDRSTGSHADPQSRQETLDELPWVADADESRQTQRRGVRVGTVVWGLVLTAIGVGLLALASGVVFDVELALIILVACAGVALLVGSLVTEARRRS